MNLLHSTTLRMQADGGSPGNSVDLSADLGHARGNPTLHVWRLNQEVTCLQNWQDGIVYLPASRSQTGEAWLSS